MGEADAYTPGPELYHALWEYGSDLVAILDADGRYRHASPSYQRILGYTPAELHGRNAFEFVHPDDLASAQAAFDVAARAKGTPITTMLRFRHADGAWRMLETTGSGRLADPVVRGLVINSRDVTEREALLAAARAERAAAELERERLRQVLDVLPAAVQLVDADGRFVMSNRVANDIVGGDVMGRPIPLAESEALDTYGVRHLDGSLYPSRELPLQRALHDGAEVRGEQVLVYNAREGREVPILVTSAPLRDVAGASSGAVIVFQDISALRELERTRDEFLSSASHDLKTPLATIHGFAQLARRRLDHVADPAAAPIATLLERIEAASTRMLRLIVELVDVTRLQMGDTLALEQGPTDIVALVRTVVEQQEGSAPVLIRMETAVPELPGLVDPARLERVVSNLLSNTVKYSPRGGDITVTVAREDGPSGPEAIIAVRDEGMGIPAADLPHIFERFRRAGNVVGHIQGSGIGLASAWHIVEQHGGTIAVDSTEGVGSTFTVRLPLTES